MTPRLRGLAMCMIESSDGDWLFLQEPVERTSRRDRRCEECGRVIAKGERYIYAYGVQDGEYTISWHCCMHCYVVADDWLTPVCHGFLFGGVAEDLAEHMHEPWPIRGVALARLVRLMRRQWRLRGGGLASLDDVRRWATASAERAMAA